VGAFSYQRGTSVKGQGAAGSVKKDVSKLFGRLKVSPGGGDLSDGNTKVHIRLHGKGNSKLPWRSTKASSRCGGLGPVGCQ
jgi:hypothetical protein